VEFSIGERPYCLVIPRVCKFINLGLRTINWIVTFESIGLTFILFLIIDYLMFEPVRLVFFGRKYGGNGWLESLSVNQVKREKSTDIEYLGHYKNGIRIEVCEPRSHPYKLSSTRRVSVGNGQGAYMCV